MKKIFYFLSMAVLMIMATGCEKGTNAIVEPVNEGEENILYSYHMITESLVGGTLVNADAMLVANGFTMVSSGYYKVMENDYIVTVTFRDTNSDEIVEVMDVTFTPAEVAHNTILTYNCLTEFLNLVGEEVKLFSSVSYCSFYGFQTPEGDWLAFRSLASLSSEVDEESIGTGKIYWVDDNVTDFYQTEEPERTYTGMFVKATGMERIDEESEKEYSIQINYSINQPY